MANSHIEVGSSTRLSSNLRSFTDQLWSVHDTAERTKAIFDQVALGGDYVALGATLGLTGTSASADAEAIYNLIGSVVTELNATFIGQYLSRLG